MNVKLKQISRRRGFSVVEVMLALMIVAFALLTLMELLPVGLQSSRDATTSATIGHILEDAHERLEGHALEDGVPDSCPLYYDEEGIFLPYLLEKDFGIKKDQSRPAVYRVDVRLVTPIDEKIKERAPGLKAAILSVSWPVNAEGEVPGGRQSQNYESVTYYVNSLTGARWSEIDDEFETLIEY